MSTNDPKDVDRAHPSWLGAQRQRASHMESAEFGRTLRGLLDGLEIDIFEEEWQQVTIVNRAKELALKTDHGNPLKITSILSRPSCPSSSSSRETSLTLAVWSLTPGCRSRKSSLRVSESSMAKNVAPGRRFVKW